MNRSCHQKICYNETVIGYIINIYIRRSIVVARSNGVARLIPSERSERSEHFVVTVDQLSHASLVIKGIFVTLGGIVITTA